MRTAVTISTPASAASGISATSAAPKNTTSDEHERVDDRGDARAGTGAHVDRGAGDRAGRRHAAEQRRHDVRQALAEQLAVGVVAAGVGHAVGDLGRQQALDRGQRGDRERRRRDSSLIRRCDMSGSDGVGSESGSAPMRGDVEVGELGDRRSPPTTASSDAGSDRGARGARP